jgi:uncharacterized protein YdeI (YjbR/CyaY-like superfamily)
MAKTDPRVDAYIEHAADFAKPILEHVRKLVHTACPEVEEAIKWQFPCFLYKGMLCHMAAFKNHCTFGFWKHKLIFGKPRSTPMANGEGMGQFGRLTAMSDLPNDRMLLSYIKQAVRLNHEGVKVPAPARTGPKKPLLIPDFFTSALRKNKRALATFENFSYSHKKEYVEWISEAKGADTRQRRLETTLAWLAEGKPRNWKYLNC